MWDEGELEHVACLPQEEAAAIRDLVQTIQVIFLPSLWDLQAAEYQPHCFRWCADCSMVGDGACGL